VVSFVWTVSAETHHGWNIPSQYEHQARHDKQRTRGCCATRCKSENQNPSQPQEGHTGKASQDEAAEWLKRRKDGGGEVDLESLKESLPPNVFEIVQLVERPNEALDKVRDGTCSLYFDQCLCRSVISPWMFQCAERVSRLVQLLVWPGDMDIRTSLLLHFVAVPSVERLKPRHPFRMRAGHCLLKHAPIIAGVIETLCKRFHSTRSMERGELPALPNALKDIVHNVAMELLELSVFNG